VEFPYYSSSAWLVQLGKRLAVARSRRFTPVSDGAGDRERETP